MSAEVRSKDLDWVTAAVGVAAGASRCGRMTVAKTMLQATTALSSGTKPL